MASGPVPDRNPPAHMKDPFQAPGQQRDAERHDKIENRHRRIDFKMEISMVIFY
jgi:hypothetical protein